MFFNPGMTIINAVGEKLTLTILINEKYAVKKAAELNILNGISRSQYKLLK